MKLTPKKLKKFIDIVYHGNATIFARDIQYNPYTVRKWCAGERSIPQEKLEPEMIRLARFYAGKFVDVAKLLEDENVRIER